MEQTKYTSTYKKQNRLLDHAIICRLKKKEDKKGRRQLVVSTVTTLVLVIKLKPHVMSRCWINLTIVPFKMVKLLYLIFTRYLNQVGLFCLCYIPWWSLSIDFLVAYLKKGSGSVIMKTFNLTAQSLLS